MKEKDLRRGEAPPPPVFHFDPADTRAIRQKVGASQSQFALMIGVSVSTLRHWEQGRRQPEGPACPAQGGHGGT